MDNNQLLVRSEEELKPTINQLMEDQKNYNPFEDNEYLEQGSFLLNRFAQAKKAVEDQRVAFTKPLNESLRSINSFFKQFSDPIDQADKALRAKLAQHRKELEYKRLEEQMRIEEENKKLVEEAKAQGKPAPVILKEEVPDLKSKIGAVVVKKVWTFEIKDETKIPREYLSVDEVKIRASIRSGVREIEGLVIFQKDEVSL